MRAKTTCKPPNAPIPGQFAFDAPEPWQASRCQCWPPVPRGCGHCQRCDTCQDCRRCAGSGCVCACQA